MRENESATQGMFEWLQSDPQMLANWNAFMSGRRGQRKQWYDLFPAARIILEGARDEDNAILLVDVGGGEGMDAECFRKTFPEAPGKVILQDLHEVIYSIKQLDPEIIRMGHDFFTPQPKKGQVTKSPPAFLNY